eukprot:gnl/TRDRNA2_/TRDRNA2_203244_c0_seq1.p1 gnl/TRDRNA2_/TRDRNA2_203244_c0~~gnl/TRDRNA2_/TRDRNA2_203244_c0_seq1.p1  ORF type:complete len:344 (-),score=20.61 gnl/TRDRNA2_/TRDRNA2_203244_c0_seq1:236-1267(-)
MVAKEPVALPYTVWAQIASTGGIDLLFVLCCTQRDLKVLRTDLSAVPPLPCRIDSARLLMLYATSDDRISMLSLLLDTYGLYVDSVPSRGYPYTQNLGYVNDAVLCGGKTPLMLATQHGCEKTVKCLLTRKANANATMDNGRSALMFAERVSIAKMLIEHGASVNTSRADCGQTVLYEQSRHGRLEIVRLLLKYAADVNIRSHSGQTALLAATHKGHARIVHHLIEHMADLSLSFIGGNTLLMEASRCGHVKVVLTLLRHKADLKTFDNYGDDAASIAFQQKHHDVLRVMYRVQKDLLRRRHRWLQTPAVQRELYRPIWLRRVRRFLNFVTSTRERSNTDGGV